MKRSIERVVLDPDFEEQHYKSEVDKKAKEIKLETRRKIADLKRSALHPVILESRIEEANTALKNRITSLYITFYNARLVTAKVNTASFYSQLYKTIFSGETLRKFKTEKEGYQNDEGEEQRNFHPDHIRYQGNRKIFSEIKAISEKNSKPWCASRQLENYCHDLLTDAFETMFTPELEYAFFRYTHRKDDQPKTNVLTNSELARKLARDTRDLLIVPSNLLFSMLLSSNRDSINQESNKGPDEAHYWKIYGNLITRLHQEEEPIRGIAEAVGADTASQLCLDDLAVIRGQSPGGIYCSGRQIKPFQITRYYNATETWSNHLKKNHEWILTELLKIRDLYAEFEGVPF